MPESHHVSAFKGYFPEGTKKFKEFIEKENKKSKVFCFSKKRKPNKQNEKLANKQNLWKNGLQLIRNKSKKSISKSHNDKTRANDTLSR